MRSYEMMAAPTACNMHAPGIAHLFCTVAWCNLCQIKWPACVPSVSWMPFSWISDIASHLTDGEVECCRWIGANASIMRRCRGDCMRTPGTVVHGSNPVPQCTQTILKVQTILLYLILYNMHTRVSTTAPLDGDCFKFNFNTFRSNISWDIMIWIYRK